MPGKYPAKSERKIGLRNRLPSRTQGKTRERAAATSEPAMIGPHCRKEVLISTRSRAISSVSPAASTRRAASPGVSISGARETIV